MRPFEFLAKVQNSYIKNTGEDVIYKTITQETTNLKCSVQNGNILNSQDEFFENACTFMGVKLSSTPKSTDIILHNNIEWRVGAYAPARKWTDIIDGVEIENSKYDIVGYNKQHNPTNHKQYRRGGR